MPEWHCFKCKEKMIPDADLSMRYLRVTRTLPGLKCPKCGEAYLTEKIVIRQVMRGEKIISSKG